MGVSQCTQGDAPGPSLCPIPHNHLTTPKHACQEPGPDVSDYDRQGENYFQYYGM